MRKKNYLIKPNKIKNLKSNGKFILNEINKIPESARIFNNNQEILNRSPKKFQGPLTNLNVLENFKHYLTERELIEILSFPEVYYIREILNLNKKDFYSSFIFRKDDHISYRYQMIQIIGEGSFGFVIKCFDHKNKENVAIKLIRDLKKIHDQILLEKDFLNISQNDGGFDKYHIIKYKENFIFRGYFCLVMELASINLFSIISSQPFNPFSKNIFKMISKQVAESLYFLHNKGIIHCDIKPENILFSNHRRNSIKLIDFGCSCFENQTIYTYIQSRYYRAPEIVLESEYSKEIDIWSYGCLLCELFNGKPLFEVDDEDELIFKMISLIGIPPKELLIKSKRSKFYFDNNFNPLPEFFCQQIPLEEIINFNDPYLLSLIKGCLKWDPKKRLTPENILNHPYFTFNNNVCYMRT